MSSPDDNRRLAATYVLGTLDGNERALVRARLAQEPDFAALVRLWEERFAPLHALSPAVRPPADLWDTLLAALPVPEVEPEPEPEADAGVEEPPAEMSGSAEAEIAIPVQATSPDATDTAPTHLPADDSAAGPLAPSATGDEGAVPLEVRVAGDGGPAPDMSEAPAVPPAEAGSPAPVLAAPGDPIPAPPERASPSDPSDGPADASGGPADMAPAPEEGPAAPVEPASAEPAPVEAVPLAEDIAPAGEGGARPETLPAGEAPVAASPAPVEPDAPASTPPETASDGRAEGTAVPPAEETVPPPRPRGPFDIVIERPAPTGREGASEVPAEPAPETGSPWRLTTGLLLVAGLIGGGAVAYREMHRQAPPPDVFAPLKSSPDPLMVLAFDPEAGDVVVRQLDAPPPDGMVYRMWLVSHEHGTRALCSFTAAGRCPSGALGTVGRAGLMGGALQVTLEPLGLSLATPTGKVVFYGRALTR